MKNFREYLNSLPNSVQWFIAWAIVMVVTALAFLVMGVFLGLSLPQNWTPAGWLLYRFVILVAAVVWGLATFSMASDGKTPGKL